MKKEIREELSQRNSQATSILDTEQVVDFLMQVEHAQQTSVMD